MTDGAIRLSWGDQLEIYTIPTLGHGTPIDSSDVGQAAPFILDVGISSSRRIAKFWGLVPQTVSRPAPKPVPKATPVHIAQPALPKIEVALASPETRQRTAENIIRRALRAAGLLKR
jgi:hypothetical protein